MPEIKLIVWDFDGVLNANVVDGRFVWTDQMQSDLDLDPKAFSAFLFGSGLMHKVICGKVSLMEVVATWLRTQNTDLTARDFLDYWFARDALPDSEVFGWMRAAAGRRVIGTNNETLRATYIETQMQFGQHVEHVFASGRMGVAKPDAGFWTAVERWSGVERQNILLVDDSEQNVEACQAQGWQVFHFTKTSRSDLPVLLGLA